MKLTIYFPTELRESLSKHCGTHEAIDDALREWLTDAIDSKGIDSSRRKSYQTLPRRFSDMDTSQENMSTPSMILLVAPIRSFSAWQS